MTYKTEIVPEQMLESIVLCACNISENKTLQQSKVEKYKNLDRKQLVLSVMYEWKWKLHAL